ncbi:HlyD family secretion protein [Pendulispora rubella]|uniref:HlyD family secretion protein n=1 Tax=Pendulispora rubella TaxID=2741070 RepID=A0ABZ2KZL3_9BACT
MTEAASSSKKAYVSVGGGIALVLLAILLYALHGRGKESTDDAQVDADVVSISARVSGPVLEVPVDEDQWVKKGALLVRLDDSDYQARLKQAQAELAQARAQVAQAEVQEQIVTATAKGGIASARALVQGSAVGVDSAVARVASATAALARAKAEAKNAEVQLHRDKSLRADNAIPQAQLDTAQTNADTARAALAAAEANLAAAVGDKREANTRVAEAQGRLTQSAPVEIQLASARAQTEFQRGRVASAEAAIALAQTELEATRIVAPCDGYVANITVHPGALLGAGAAVAQVVPKESYIVANFKETQLDRMRVGQRVEISIDAFEHYPFEGKVESVAAGTGARFSLLPADNASGNFVKVVQRVPVHISIANAPPDLLLRAGLSANVTVHVR